MADTLLIEAEPREAGSSNEARRMRRERKLPAVVYGGDKESNTITLNPREIITILKSDSGQNTIFKLKVNGGAEQNVMIFDVQIDPITRQLVHADLVRIAMDVLIEVDVPIEIVGEPIGVTVDGGVLDHSLRELTVECLPGNIPDQVEIDVSELGIHDSIRVEDIVLPPDVKLITDPERSVASVVPPVSEADLEVAVDEEELELAEGEEAPEGEEEAAEGEEGAEESEQKDDAAE